MRSLPWQRIPDGHYKNLVILYWHVLTENIGKAEQTTAIARCTFREHNNRARRLSSYFFKSQWTRAWSWHLGSEIDQGEKGGLTESSYWDPRQRGPRRYLNVRRTCTGTTAWCMCNGGWSSRYSGWLWQRLWDRNDKNRIISCCGVSRWIQI